MTKSGETLPMFPEPPRERPHLFLRNESTRISEFKYKNRGGVQNKQSETDDPVLPETKQDFEPDLTVLSECTEHFIAQQKQRHQKRSINHLHHQDYVTFVFAKAVSPEQLKKYPRHFGLVPVHPESYHRKITFAIENEARFLRLKNLQEELISDLGPVESFHLFTSKDRFRITEKKQNNTFKQVNLRLFDSVALFEKEGQMREELVNYLQDQNQRYQMIPEANLLELYTHDIDFVQRLLDNFDIIFTAQSSHLTIVRPGVFNTLQRTPGFALEVAESAPILGIIDSGISGQTPLQKILISDSEFDLTYTDPSIDEYDHGTAVGLLAATGEAFYEHRQRERGTVLTFTADARLLSIKVLTNQQTILSYKSLLELIRRAHLEYQVRLFTLTLGEVTSLPDNEIVSPHAFLLDSLAAELDILICISAGNRSNFGFSTYPELFKEKDSNLKSPAEAMNHLTIGAIAQNFSPTDGTELSPDKNYPAIYTTKFHGHNISSALNTKNNPNRHLFKPDLVHAGGDYSRSIANDKIPALHDDSPALEVLSSKPEQGYYRHVGTSFATPLVANQALKIMRRYPQIKMQTVKALLINSADNPWQTRSAPDFLKELDNEVGIKYLVGHGLADTERCLNSLPERTTILVEEKINIDKHAIGFPFSLPPGLADLPKTNLLKVTATLCYAFQPVLQGHLQYCPAFITFGFTKNEELEELNRKKSEDIRFNPQSGFTSDNYYNRQPISNVQKKSFLIKKEHLVNNQNKLQIVFRSKWHGFLTAVEKQKLHTEQAFSFVLEIEALDDSFDLYSELQLVNNLEAVADLYSELDIDDLEI